MNTTDMKGKGNVMQRIFSHKSETVTGNEMIYAEGENKEIFEKLQIRFGKSKEEMHRIISALYTSL